MSICHDKIPNVLGPPIVRELPMPMWLREVGTLSTLGLFHSETKMNATQGDVKIGQTESSKESICFTNGSQVSEVFCPYADEYYTLLMK